MPQHVEHCTLHHPRGAFTFINFLTQLHIVVQVYQDYQQLNPFPSTSKVLKCHSMKNTVHCTTPGVPPQGCIFNENFSFINFLTQLHIVEQVSLPNPYGKIKKINHNSPAVDQKRRQTTWIEVHQWLLKPELSMERPLLVIVPAFQSILDRSPQK